jgi:hypothetical protein
MLKLQNRTMSQSEDEVLELLGTVREIVGKGGLIYPSNSNNVKDITKRMLITLEDKQGNKEVLLTSPAVNKRLRSKEISLSEVLDYPIYLTKVTDQESGMISERAVIGVAQGKDLKELAVSADSKAVVVVEDIKSYESLLRY